jgi:hypothetical protein
MGEFTSPTIVQDEREELKHAVLLGERIAKEANSRGRAPLIPLLLGSYLQRKLEKNSFPHYRRCRAPPA